MVKVIWTDRVESGVVFEVSYILHALRGTRRPFFENVSSSSGITCSEFLEIVLEVGASFFWYLEGVGSSPQASLGNLRK